mmetsp:Transcript_22300/g.50430  ORF Transcript_22300/g.50430 Transcript_22300/m.50430 type:complete len:310 (-) Transcript_22300:112-1041(-)
MLPLLLLAFLSAPGNALSLVVGSASSIIVGGGRIGALLKYLGTDADILVRRGEPIPPTPASGPIYVCTRNDDLSGVVEATPPERRGDLVFLQNGMLSSFFHEEGLPADVTQALLYLAVPKVGVSPVDGVTELNPEGLTCATGKWALELAGRLQNGGLRCNIKSGEAFAAAALEKHVFICVTNVVGQLNGDLTVGEVYEEKFDEERRELVDELVRAGSAEIGASLDVGQTFERLVAYGKSVPDFPTGIKEFAWRNGWFYNITQRALAARKTDPMPHHTSALARLGILPSEFDGVEPFAASLARLSPRSLQ